MKKEFKDLKVTIYDCCECGASKSMEDYEDETHKKDNLFIYKKCNVCGQICAFVNEKKLLNQVSLKQLDEAGIEISRKVEINEA